VGVALQELILMVVVNNKLQKKPTELAFLYAQSQSGGLHVTFNKTRHNCGDVATGIARSFPRARYGRPLSLNR
jgi:hypothetical protein